MSEDSHEINRRSLAIRIAQPKIRSIIYRLPTLIQLPLSLIYVPVSHWLYRGDEGPDSLGRGGGIVQFAFLMCELIAISMWIGALWDWLISYIGRRPRYRFAELWLATGFISNPFVMLYIWSTVENKFFSK